MKRDQSLHTGILSWWSKSKVFTMSFVNFRKVEYDQKDGWVQSRELTSKKIKAQEKKRKFIQEGVECDLKQKLSKEL